jgi:hypothetical protein
MYRRLGIWIVISLLGIGAAAMYKPPNVCQLQFPLSWGITKIDGEYVVLGRLYENDDPTVDVYRAESQWMASIGSWWTREPWRGRIEFYDKVSYDLSVWNTDHNTSPRLSPDQYPLIKAAMQQYYDEHGLLPADGYRTQTTYTYLAHETKMSLARIGGFLVFSVLFTWGLDWAWILIRRRIWRCKDGLCPHCAYDCKGLPTTTCPECGQDGYCLQLP